MGLKKFSMFFLFVLVLPGLMVVEGVWAEDESFAFPSYGSGPVEVRLYTDYFCPPCREMEPYAEPILKEQLKHNAIRLTLVDVPFSKLTPLYARNFLYAIKENNDLEHVLKVRNILQNAAAGKEVKTQKQIEALFKEKEVASSVWDPKPAFDRYNELIQEDKVRGTPVCVLIRDGQKKIFEGNLDIMDALRALP